MMMMMERLYDILDAGSSAVSSDEMRLVTCQLIVNNAHCLLLHQHHYTSTGTGRYYHHYHAWCL